MHTEDPQSLLARLRSGEKIPAPPIDPVRQPEVRDMFTRAEVETLIDRAVQQAIQPLIARIDALEAMVAKLTTAMSHMLDHVDHTVTRTVANAVPAAISEHLKKPIDPCAEFPDAERITKLQVQYFRNPGQRGKAADQLKVYVWTCPLAQTRNYAEGTCGVKWIPLYAPGRAAHKRFGNSLDHLEASDAKLIGCLTPGRFEKRPSQAAVVMPYDHLILNIRGQGFDLGKPKPQRDDASNGASVHTWFWPETAA